MRNNFLTTILALQVSQGMNEANDRWKSQQQFKLHQLQHQRMVQKKPVEIPPVGVKVFYALVVLLACLVIYSTLTPKAWSVVGHYLSW